VAEPGGAKRRDRWQVGAQPFADSAGVSWPRSLLSYHVESVAATGHGFDRADVVSLIACPWSKAVSSAALKLGGCPQKRQQAAWWLSRCKAWARSAGPLAVASPQHTTIFDAEQLKTRMTVVELLQVINDESLSPQLRLEVARAALPLCQDDETAAAALRLKG
jgi:hypothetical protein